MNISPVSFRSAQKPTRSFQDLICSAQSFQKTIPSAATSITDKSKKKGSAGGKIVKILVATAAIAAGLALGAKKGVFNPETSKVMKTISNGLSKIGIKPDKTVKAGQGLEKAGNWIATKASTAKNTITNLVKKHSKEVEQTVQEAIQ